MDDNEDVTWELAPEAFTGALDLPKPTQKYSLWELISHQLALAERLDGWRDLLTREGKCLSETQLKERDIFLQTAKVLQLLEAHEKKIVALVKREKKKAMSTSE